jgi:hypothetical protein
MLDAKLVGDLITAIRALFGPVIVWLGLTRGADALPIVVVLMLLDWTISSMAALRVAAGTHGAP